ncbi:MAG: hypothetical protein GX590_04525, partial [Lentisphaerae bacterium]|nr:hypothetical protein [Lentisphaerota bacterium]
LYSDAPDGARFDDILAATHDERPVQRADDLAPWMRHRVGELTTRSGRVAGQRPSDDPFAPVEHWVKTSDSNAVVRIVGATNDSPRRIEVALASRSLPWRAELIVGWQSAAQAHYRMTVEQQADRLRIALLHALPGTTNRILDAFALPPVTNSPLMLALDATSGDSLTGRLDGQAVVWAPLPAPATGASGLALAAATQAAVSLPDLRGDGMRLTDRFEKNNIYVTDPFMRHWASPEGQWLEYPGGLAWYKSDVLRQVEVRAPAAADTTLHLVIPEGETNGTLQVAVTNNLVVLRRAGAAESQTLAQLALNLFPESQPVADGPKFRFYTARLMDGIFTLGCETGLLARCRLPFPLVGRRMRMQGMDTLHLGFTRVIREPVLDCLFTESLHDWNIGGGNWEVINRFQCYPDWSHMNGESADSLAALWSKYAISGDFSIECFAGTRHGWYDRVGDLNLTILNRAETTGSGYSLTTAGWDPDHSQLWSRLFRNGTVLAQSDRYTVPRAREGNKRQGYEPLVAPGRDVHGAWYTLRLRRVGNQLTFDFDNTRILEATDPDPLARGSFGIWTYRHSMMVARVRVTADTIEPRRFAFAPLRRLPEPAPPPPEPSDGAVRPTINGWPVQLLHERYWHAGELGSHTRIGFRGPATAPEMHVVAPQGGGAFMAQADLPPIATTNLLGWRFEVARHPEARFNLEYAMGTLDKDGFTPVEWLTFDICGTKEERGPRRFAGRLPRHPEATPPGAGRLVWTPVTAWLPIEGVAKRLWVRLDGFGNLQPSDIQQGLQGNPPGAWYAIRNLRPIFSGPPVFAGVGTNNIEELLGAIRRAPAGRINSLTLPAELDPTQPTFEWGVMPGSEIALVARPAARPSHSLRVVSTLPWPNPLLTANDVRINDTAMPLAWIADNELIVPLPRGLPGGGEPIRLSLALADGRRFTQMIPAAQFDAASGKRPSPPILVRFDLTNFPACHQNFESRTVNPLDFKLATTPTLRFDDPRQGSYLRFSNNGSAAHLHGLLARNYDLARWPLLQFRYRGDPLASVSIRAVNAGIIHFSEKQAGAGRVPYAPEARMDDAWHTWVGQVSGFTLSRPVTSGFALPPTDLHVRSVANVDQTGRYSALDVDDLTAGPAIPAGQPLIFRAAYEAPGGLATSLYSVVAGATPWDDRTARQREAATWSPFSTNTWTTIAIGNLPDGVHHLVIRAQAPGSDWSPVADLPFLVDRTPVAITSAVVQTNRLNGTLLTLAFDGQGAPPLLETFHLSSNGEPLDFSRDSTSLVHYRTNGITLELNWPLLLRKAIQKGGDGTTLAIRGEGLLDAAGNASPAHSTLIRLNYAADKTPPTFPAPAAPTNAFWWAPSLPNASALFTVNRGMNAGTGLDTNGIPYVTLKTTDKEGMVGRVYNNPGWSVQTHRYLALSLRLAPDATGGTNNALFEIRFRPDKFPRGVRPHRQGAYFLAFNRQTAADQKIVVGNLKWEPGRWNDLIIDVAAFLKRESGVTDPFDVREFDIVLPASSQTLHVRAGVILAPWAPTDLFTFRAYDASGIAGLDWQGGGHAPHTALRPGLVKLPADDPAWMKLAVRDRAGNPSPPFLLPIPPATATATGLPLSEDW